MKNMMREYLGNDYTDNKVKNFCRYWLKASEGSGDTWRAGNDLDCLYFDGDLRADTLMSAWTPIKWVAECVNEENGMKFFKVARDHDDPGHYLKLLLENPDVYLPRKHPLVHLLYRFLELAELRCNFIRLPDRNMNPARYRTTIKGRDTWLYDEVPVTLSHIFDPDSLGRFFLNENGQIDKDLVTDWIISEHLEMGFKDGVIDADHVIPYSDTQEAGEPLWFTGEQELECMLRYNIKFLLNRLAYFKSEEEKITCNRIRELYEFMNSLPQPFLYEKVSKKTGYKLFYIKEVNTGHSETDSWIDIEGIETPGERFEWIQLVLEAADGDKTIERLCLSDSRDIYDETIEETLKRNDIYIPDMVFC